VTAGRNPSRTWAAIFDLDDTLYPRSAYVDSAFRAVARFLNRTRGLPPSAVLTTLRAARREATGVELQVVCERFAIPAVLVNQLRQVMRAHRPRLDLPDASRDALTRLRAEGWRLGVLTNGLAAVQRRKVEALGLGALVDHVVYAEEHSRRGKPEPRPFRVALERLRIAPARCVFIGDDPIADISGATAVGLHTIWLRPEARTAAVDQAGEAVVATLAEVPDALTRFLGASVSSAA
jgi:putative hydrolase of the HAD superfamily